MKSAGPNYPPPPQTSQRCVHLPRGGLPAASSRGPAASSRGGFLLVGASRCPQLPAPVAPRPPAATLGRLFLPETDVTRPRDGHAAFLAATRGTSPSLAQVYVWVLVHEEGGIPARRFVLGMGHTGKVLDVVAFHHTRSMSGAACRRATYPVGSSHPRPHMPRVRDAPLASSRCRTHLHLTKRDTHAVVKSTNDMSPRFRSLSASHEAHASPVTSRPMYSSASRASAAVRLPVPFLSKRSNTTCSVT